MAEQFIESNINLGDKWVKPQLACITMTFKMGSCLSILLNLSVRSGTAESWTGACEYVGELFCLGSILL